MFLCTLAVHSILYLACCDEINVLFHVIDVHMCCVIIDTSPNSKETICFLCNRGHIKASIPPTNCISYGFGLRLDEYTVRPEASISTRKFDSYTQRRAQSKSLVCDIDLTLTHCTYITVHLLYTNRFTIFVSCFRTATKSASTTRR